MNAYDVWCDFRFEHDIYEALRSRKELVPDYSKFNTIDGEEGDYGEILYTLDGQHLATKIVYGGDEEEIKLTPEGVKFFKEEIKKAFAEALESALNEHMPKW